MFTEFVIKPALFVKSPVSIGIVIEIFLFDGVNVEIVTGDNGTVGKGGQAGKGGSGGAGGKTEAPFWNVHSCGDAYNGSNGIDGSDGIVTASVAKIIIDGDRPIPSPNPFGPINIFNIIHS